MLDFLGHLHSGNVWKPVHHGVLTCALLHAHLYFASSACHVQVILMGLVEGYRVNGGPAGEGLDKVYPG